MPYTPQPVRYRAPARFQRPGRAPRPVPSMTYRQGSTNRYTEAYRNAMNRLRGAMYSGGFNPRTGQRSRPRYNTYGMNSYLQSERASYPARRPAPSRYGSEAARYKGMAPYSQSKDWRKVFKMRNQEWVNEAERAAMHAWREPQALQYEPQGYGSGYGYPGYGGGGGGYTPRQYSGYNPQAQPTRIMQQMPQLPDWLASLTYWTLNR